MGASGPVIIGTNAGGGTLARHFAPSLRRVLLLVREDWSPPKPPPAPCADTKNEMPVAGCTHQAKRLV